jgi:hypothetical protein
MRTRTPALLPFAALALLGAALSESTTVSALKDALRLATERAVATTSRANGFLDDPEIRIRLPGKLDSVARGLRAVGQGAKVDELEVAMNRAAEKAAGEATPVFVDAISGLGFEDAAGIVKGGDTAATQYFQTQTTDPLRTRFRPIVDQAMQGVGVTKLYGELLAQYQTAVPFASAPKLDLNAYVTDRALAGLFSVVGEEEKKIRTDPSAQATDLLKQVFGR